MPTTLHWAKRPGPQDGMVLSSRVRLARNWADMPFPDRMQDGHTQTNLQRVEAVMSPAEGYSFVRTGQLSALQRQALVERHVASPALLANAARSGLAYNQDESLCVMVGEEDCVRIQAFAPGLDLENCLQMANRADDKLFPAGAVAYDPTLGYLTACPTNLGTGLRASVLIHLPALSQGHQIASLQAALGKNGMALRGFYGEGSRAEGDFYQISNQVTLGYTEQELVAALNNAVQQVLEMEQNLRQRQAAQNPLAMEDKLMRWVGLLQQARLLSMRECMQALSNAMQAQSYGYYHPPRPLKHLLWDLQPATLQQQQGTELDQNQRDRLRAEKVRAYLAE